MSAGGEDQSPGSGHGAQRAGFWATVKAVLWAFVGIRRRSDYRKDAQTLDPRAVIAAGVLGGIVFVLTLVLVVRVVVAG